MGNLLGRGGDLFGCAVQLVGGGGNLEGIAGNLRNDGMDIVHEVVEPVGEFAKFVLPAGIESPGQIPFPFGNVLEYLQHATQRRGDTEDDQETQSQRNHRQHH